MPLINCEINLLLTRSENCVIINRAPKEKTVATSADDNLQFPKIDNTANVTFQITDTKLYVPVVTISTEDYNNFLEQLKSRLKRTIKWNKYRSEMTNQFIDPTFNKFNRLVVLSFENEEHLFQSITHQKLK